MYYGGGGDDTTSSMCDPSLTDTECLCAGVGDYYGLLFLYFTEGETHVCFLTRGLNVLPVQIHFNGLLSCVCTRAI